ncbi:hypothetical protein [Microbacterium sp.]|uniref:DUF7927 domain-containing protein n=1 Tax=Microbacterium sp. TaxID=51671 RepID=UPI0039E2F40F
MRAAASMIVTGALAFAGLFAASPAFAATPVYEIEGEWIDQPTGTVEGGDGITALWRVNVNDAEVPPSNDPVDNVVVTFVIDNALFEEIPDICLRSATDPDSGVAVDPISAISTDKTTLTCNLGTVNMGTAVSVMTPVSVLGPTGSHVTLSGTIDGQTVDLPEIPIENPFAMDMKWSGTSVSNWWNDDFTSILTNFQLSLWAVPGGDAGPASVTYRLTLTDNQGGVVTIADKPEGLGGVTEAVTGGCSAQGAYSPGHPLSTGASWSPALQAPAFGSCTLTAVAGQPGKFDLTISGIDYSQTQIPILDSASQALPSDRVPIGAAQLWFNVATTTGGSLSLSANAPTYTSVNGATFQDCYAADTPTGFGCTANNSTNKTRNLPGAFVHQWVRTFTGSGGTRADDTYTQPAGSLIQSWTSDAVVNANWSDNEQRSLCTTIDTRYVTYESHFVQNIESAPHQIQYYVGNDATVNPAAGNAAYNPDQFDCGITSGWVNTAPADLSTVKAVRVNYLQSAYAEAGAGAFVLRVNQRLNADLEVGQDVWTFGSTLRPTTGWIGPDVQAEWTETPDARYPHTTGRRDIVRIVLATPAIRKSADKATFVPGVPAEFTLTYSANWTGAGPDEVDDFVIEDVLPAGMTYVEGSASPEPVVTIVNGAQVLTWTLDDVTTNEWHTLTYQVVGDNSIVPGTRFRNVATATLANATSNPAAATVTSSANGYTTLIKTSDVDYIPNNAGDGVGTGSWTITLESHDPFDQAYTDTIDILPYNGDGRGTDYSGSYVLDSVTAPVGAIVYYTDADPATITYDPADPSNGSAGSIVGNTVGWTTVKPANPTAVRVIGGVLESGGSFAFQVQITTNGAEPQDVYVNSAQARAEHTELVMRTSAALTVTDYIVEKTSNPNGGTVIPGQVVEYTVTVTQQGDVPAGALFTDDLSDVLDDAVYNGDVSATHGAATIVDGELSWEGDVPVGEVATITYSVTVKTTDLIEAEGNWILKNVVTSPGCESVDSCSPPANPVGDYRFSKTSDPASGSDVTADDVVTYHVQISHIGAAAVEKASVTDDLSAVLDDATWNDDAEATDGTLEYTDGELVWTGDLEVGQVVDITYSVTVTGHGDWQLANIVSDACTTDDDGCVPPPPGGRCVAAADGNPDCQTVHQIGSYEISKGSDPVTGSDVQVGDTVTYTVTVTQLGLAGVDASITDDLSDVIDDASWNGDLVASQGDASYEDGVLEWSGELAVGDVVTITYSVTVLPEGDLTLRNVVSSPDPFVECVLTDGQDEPCTTEHYKGRFVYSKTSNPKPGSTVEEGDVVTYTVTVAQVGPGSVSGASLVDDISDVLEVTTWNDDATATSGEVVRDGDQVTWVGDLAVGQTVTITYSVTVNVQEDAEFRNAVTSDDPRGACVDAADGNPDCETEHFIYKGNFVYSKTSDPASGSTVEEGDVVTYTVTVEQVGRGPVRGASLVDDISDVLEVASWNDDAQATSGEVVRDGDQVTWVGDLEVGQTVTITYSVTVGDQEDAEFRNVVTSDDPRGSCVDAADGNPDCQTEHNTYTGEFVYSKTSNPTSGSTVAEGNVVTYTVTVAQVGVGPVRSASLVDDISDVLQVASWNDDAQATSGEVVRDGDQLTWVGDLEVGQTVTITYSVTVGAKKDVTFRNVVTSDDPRGACVDAADGNPDCKTVHNTPSSLAITGLLLSPWTLTGAAVMIVGGGLLVLLARRRRQAAEQSVDIDELF